jgi:hypothetical protein
MTRNDKVRSEFLESLKGGRACQGKIGIDNEPMGFGAAKFSPMQRRPDEFRDQYARAREGSGLDFNQRISSAADDK